MKKTLVGAILGIGASIVSSYGQGQIIFSNYISSTLVPVVWGGVEMPGFPLPGTLVSASDHATAELFYGLGIGLYADDLKPLPASITDVGTLLPGLISPVLVTLPDWTGGPVTFGIGFSSPLLGNAFNVPWQTWTEPASSITATGMPANTFTLSLLQAEFPGGIPGFILIPEPAELALLVLGTAAFLIFRRRP